MRWALGVLVFFSGPLWGQSVTIPATVTVPPGRMATVQVAYEGDDFRYQVSSNLDSFREYDPDPKKVRLRVIGYPSADGQPYQGQVIAVAAKGGKLSDFAVCTVQVGTAPVPPVPPGPGPGPNPPTPVDPAPLPDAKGLHVLIVYEKGQTLPASQHSIVYGTAVREYLDSKTPLGPDNKTHEWRIYDKDEDVTGESKTWQDAMKRPRKSIPWVLISNPGKGGTEVPLPDSPDKFLELVKKYE